MTPSLVTNIDPMLQNPDVRKSIEQMHAEKMPLKDMIVALGMEDELDPKILEIVAKLPTDVVDGIRAATLKALAGKQDEYRLPLDCDVAPDDIKAGKVDVNVTVVDSKITTRKKK